MRTHAWSRRTRSFEQFEVRLYSFTLLFHLAHISFSSLCRHVPVPTVHSFQTSCGGYPQSSVCHATCAVDPAALFRIRIHPAWLQDNSLHLE